MKWLQKTFQLILILLSIGGLGFAQALIITNIIPKENSEELQTLQPISPKNSSASSEKALELPPRKPNHSKNNLQAVNPRQPQPDLETIEK